MRNFVDLHTHSINSGHAFHTIDELIKTAKKRNIQYLGITEHGSSMAGTSHLGYFEMLPEFPKRVNGVNVYMGVEANILNTDGLIDIPVETQNKLNLIIVGLHKQTPYVTNNKTANTQAIISAIEANKVHIISHPINMSFEIDLYDVVTCAIKNNVLIELNNRTFQSLTNKMIAEYRNMILHLKSHNFPIVLNSDAHMTYDIGNIKNILKLFSELNLDEKMILNYHPEQIKEYIP